MSSTCVLVASDLDRTLIYSRAAMALATTGAAVECVELYEGEPASFLTARAAELLVELSTVAHLVPVTTRIRRQYERIRLPGPMPRYAVVANGGQLLVDGAPDADWAQAVRGRLAECAPQAEIWAHLQAVCRPEWTRSLRDADGLFCYAVVDPAAVPARFVDEVGSWALARGWRTSFQGRKLYWVPAPLTKAAAVAEVRDRLGASTVLAAGDSLLDIDLLMVADRGIRPAHGELHDAGWQAPHVEVTSTAGAGAGEQIVQWFLTAATGATADPAARVKYPEHRAPGSDAGD